MKYKIILFFFWLPLRSIGQEKKEQLNLMPWPQHIKINDGSNFALNKNFKINITGNVDSRIGKAATQFLRRLDGRTGLFFTQGYVKNPNEEPQAQLQIHCSKKGITGLDADESYQLVIKSESIIIEANTDLGAQYALETVLQLVQTNTNGFYFPCLEIKDYPSFTWRGLMIDAARHFQPVEVIKRNIDAMAAVKLNVLHWHLVDDQGWRIELKNKPALTDLASDGEYYTQEQIKEIVRYADQKGITVVPEIDVPGHASALLTVYPEIGSRPVTHNKPTYGIERNAGIFTPTLDPSNPKTYQILSEIFDEVCPLFPGKYFHIGGDENQGKDWDENPAIQKFKQANNLKTNHELQAYFTLKLIPMFKKHHKELMGWEEIMTDKIPKESIIHMWKGENEGVSSEENLVKASKKGFKTVVSNGFYIDLMLGVEAHYKTQIIPKKGILTPIEKKNILGGEATMWSELVTPQTIDSRIWPRTAAIAERFWSSDSLVELKNWTSRLESVSNRLEELGITHLKNKDVLLRNCSNYNDIQALKDFSNICEPLKRYSRNKGGTEYQMHAPLTLFADACNADAVEAKKFEEAVDNYLNQKNPENLKKITNYFKKWIQVNVELVNLSEKAPLVKPILPLSIALSDLSKELLRAIENNQEIDLVLFNKLYLKCESKENADVELAVTNAIKKYISGLTR